MIVLKICFDSQVFRQKFRRKCVIDDTFRHKNVLIKIFNKIKIQDRRSVRDFHQHREGGNRSDRFNDRSSGSNYRREDHSRDRSFNRRHSPPAMRSRDDSRGFRERDNSSSRRRMSPPPPRRESKPSIKSRLNPPLRSSIRAVGSALARSRLARATGSSRILRRNDLRSGLIAKRTAPVNRAKDYAKKIRQARLKLSERSGSARKSQSRGRSTSSKMNSEDKSPKKETDGGEASRKQENDNEEVDYLAIANDVNFDEDENESTTGGKVKSATEDKEKLPKELSEADKKPKEEASKDDSKPSRNRSPSKEFDYKCVHCDMHLSSGQVRFKILIQRTYETKISNSSLLNVGLSQSLDQTHSSSCNERCCS